MKVAVWMNRSLHAALIAKAACDATVTPIPKTGTDRAGVPSSKTSPATLVVLRLIETYVRGDSEMVTPAPSEPTREAG